MELFNNQRCFWMDLYTNDDRGAQERGYIMNRQQLESELRELIDDPEELEKFLSGDTTKEWTGQVWNGTFTVHEVKDWDELRDLMTWKGNKPEIVTPTDKSDIDYPYFVDYDYRLKHYSSNIPRTTMETLPVGAMGSVNETAEMCRVFTGFKPDDLKYTPNDHMAACQEIADTVLSGEEFTPTMYLSMLRKHHQPSGLWCDRDKEGGSYNNDYLTVSIIRNSFTNEDIEKFEDAVFTAMEDEKDKLRCLKDAFYCEIDKTASADGIEAIVFDIHKGDEDDAKAVSHLFPDAVVFWNYGWDIPDFGAFRNGEEYDDYTVKWENGIEPEPYEDFDFGELYDVQLDISIKLPFTDKHCLEPAGMGSCSHEDFKYYKSRVTESQAREEREKQKESLDKNAVYYGVVQSHHGHEYRYMYTKDALEKAFKTHKIDIDIPQDPGDYTWEDILWPVGGSNCSSAYIECLNVPGDPEALEKARDFLIEGCDGPDSEDPLLVDLAEYICSIETSPDYSDNCAGAILDYYGLDAERYTKYDDRVDDVLKRMGIDFSQLYDDEYRDMRYSDVCEHYPLPNYPKGFVNLNGSKNIIRAALELLLNDKLSEQLGNMTRDQVASVYSKLKHEDYCIRHGKDYSELTEDDFENEYYENARDAEEDRDVTD